jgi:putative ABC transport system permease protein
MKKADPIQPPRWAERFLEWYCRPELLEDLQGDLNEFFHRHCKSVGVTRAKLIYVMDVLKFLRIYTLRKPEFINLLIHWIMIGSYIKTSGRSIVRNKLFSAINIIGLAVSMSVGLLLLSMTSDLLSYDDFHSKKDRIYRVNTTDVRSEQGAMDLASTTLRAGKEMKEAFTGIESITLLRRGFAGDASLGDKVVPMSGFWTDESFFNVFDFPLIEGDVRTALKEPYSLVLTERSAKKIFGNTQVVGKSLKFDTTDYVITGVLQDIPKLSHMSFEALVSLSTIEGGIADPDGELFSWRNIYMSYIYLVLPENGNPVDIQHGLDKLAASENAALENRKISLWLQPLSEIPFSGDLSNSIGPVFHKVALWVLGGLAFIVILSACFNYTNLSIARSLRRSREVGIRKVVGAQKRQVVTQFITESVIISVLALAFSFILFLFLRTQLLSVHEFISSVFALELSPTVLLWFFTLAIVVGALAGFLPALFFSRIQAIQVLKDASSLKVFRHVSMRKALIAVQYTFSLIFITTTIIGYNQYRGFITYDLGYKTENIINIRLDGTNGAAVAKELSELPEVQGISRSILVTSVGSMYGTQLKYKNDSASIWINLVDENYIPLHEHKLLAGRNFKPRAEGADETEVIVNEHLLKQFNIASRTPESALGEVVDVDGKKLAIVGVVKDFHYGTSSDKIQPIAFQNSPAKTSGYINVKVASNDLPATMEAIGNAWRKIDKVHPLDAKFYDDQIQEAYSQFSVMIKVIGFLSFLAVVISSMGLFGMVVFTTETRLKEITIRKVLGATDGTLIYILSRGFLFLLAISAFIAIPLTWIFFDQVLLPNFAYHQPIAITELVAGAAIVMVIAFVMIGSQTLKAARTNPATVLKNE